MPQSFKSSWITVCEGGRLVFRNRNGDLSTHKMRAHPRRSGNTVVPLSKGAEVYVADIGGVLARGSLYTNEEVDAALRGRVMSILWDDAGSADLEVMFADFTSTSFEDELVQEVLESDPSIEDWRIGEAFAEAYLVDHRECEFPWPTGRDLKNPSASPAGTDLVGFHKANNQTRFAFGEVKTAPQKEWPPSVMTGWT
jgi:hypothetical protein